MEIAIFFLGFFMGSGICSLIILISHKNHKEDKDKIIKDDFLSIASHQLRTPLTSIKGYLSMLLEGDAGEVNDLQKRFLMEAFNSSERMVRIIGDFLGVSRVPSGKFELQKEEGDLAKIIDEELIVLQEIAKTRNIKIKFNKKHKKIIFSADFSKLRQVIMNMIDNAIFYSEKDSEIAIEVGEDKKYAYFKVTDSGIGVPATQQGKLFTKFYRGSNAQKKRPDGTGVGLYLSKKIIDEHNGEIIFYSQEGKGSTFGFKIKK